MAGRFLSTVPPGKSSSSSSSSFFFKCFEFWAKDSSLTRDWTQHTQDQKMKIKFLDCYWTDHHWTAMENPKRTILEWTISWHLVDLQCQGTTEMKWSESRSVMSNSLPPHGLYGPWNSPGQKTGVGSLSFFQGIFPTQGSNLGFPHCRQILYQLNHRGSPPLSNSKYFLSPCEKTHTH